MGTLKFKDNVKLYSPMPIEGQIILGALVIVSNPLSYDLVVTSGADGVHSGPNDPHFLGKAFDVHSHGLPDKQQILLAVMHQLSISGEKPTPKDNGLVTNGYFGWLEDPGGENEHYHIQLRHGTQILV